MILLKKSFHCLLENFYFTNSDIVFKQWTVTKTMARMAITVWIIIICWTPWLWLPVWTAFCPDANMKTKLQNVTVVTQTMASWIFSSFSTVWWWFPVEGPLFASLYPGVEFKIWSCPDASSSSKSYLYSPLVASLLPSFKLYRCAVETLESSTMGSSWDFSSTVSAAAADVTNNITVEPIKES